MLEQYQLCYPHDKAYSRKHQLVVLMKEWDALLQSTLLLSTRLLSTPLLSTSSAFNSSAFKSSPFTPPLDVAADSRDARVVSAGGV